MFASLMSTPTRFSTRGTVEVTPRWMEHRPQRLTGQRKRLGPGVYIVLAQSWKPTSVLDIGEFVPPVTDVEPIRRRIPMPEWHAWALCNGDGDADATFFGVDDVRRPALPPTAVRRARGMCMACPVARECLTQALRQPEEFGIWGGTTGRQRRKLQVRLAQGATVEELVEECLTTSPVSAPRASERRAG